MFFNTYKSLQLLIVIFCTIDAVPVLLSSSEVFESWGSTEIKIVKLKYTWTIENFRFCSQDTGENLISPMFLGRSNDTCKWNLSLYPKGSDQADKDYISVYINSSLCNNTASFHLGIINSKQKKINVLGDNKKFELGANIWGYNNFITRSFLFNKENEVLLHDKLTIFCELNVTVGIENNSGVLAPSNHHQPSNDKHYLVENLTFLLQNQNVSDVTLSAGGEEFQALKVILITQSPVFKEIFKNDVHEASVTRVELNDVEPEILKEMLRYIYTEESPNLDYLAYNLLAAAEKYELPGLKKMCERSLSANLSVENAADYFVLADNYTALNLKSDAKNFIVAHASQVAKSKGLKLIIEANPVLATELFQAVSSSASCN